jgi:hypothetical protein
MRLLVVDFDFFFPVVEDPQDPRRFLYDWAHFETPYHLLEAWERRALAFLLRGLDLPMPRGYEGFWQRVEASPQAVLYYADSNALAFHPQVRRGVREVVLFDAHHDAGYRPVGEEPACDDWMVFYHREGARLSLRYPSWRAHALVEEPEPQVPLERRVDEGGPVLGVDRIFLARSGAWVPPWADGAFFAFLASAPWPKVNLDGVAPRPFDLEALRRRAQEEALGLRVMERLLGIGPGQAEGGGL